jgi:hypothetical protein
MSIQFAVAAVLSAGGMLDRAWRDYADSAVNDLAARTRLSAAKSTGESSTVQSVGIRARLYDGHVVTAWQNNFRSMSREEVIERFLASAEGHVSPAAARAFLDDVAGLERLEEMGTCLRRLAPDPRARTADRRMAVASQ